MRRHFFDVVIVEYKGFPFVVQEELITSSVCKILGWSILIQLFAGHSNTSSLTSYISSLRDKLTLAARVVELTNSSVSFEIFPWCSSKSHPKNDKVSSYIALD